MSCNMYENYVKLFQTIQERQCTQQYLSTNNNRWSTEFDVGERGKQIASHGNGIVRESNQKNCRPQTRTKSSITKRKKLMERKLNGQGTLMRKTTDKEDKMASKVKEDDKGEHGIAVIKFKPDGKLDKK